MLKRFEKTDHSQILVETIDDVTNYGRVDCQGINMKHGNHVLITGMVEKLAINLAHSNLAIVGRYILSSNICKILKHKLPGIIMKFS